MPVKFNLQWFFTFSEIKFILIGRCNEKVKIKVKVRAAAWSITFNKTEKRLHSNLDIGRIPILFFKTSLLHLQELLRGLAVTLGNMFKEPATINYPFEKGPLSPRYSFDVLSVQYTIHF